MNGKPIPRISAGLKSVIRIFDEVAFVTEEVDRKTDLKLAAVGTRCAEESENQQISSDTVEDRQGDLTSSRRVLEDALPGKRGVA